MQSRVIHVTSVEQFKELQQKGKDTKRSVRPLFELPALRLSISSLCFVHSTHDLSASFLRSLWMIL